jgi:cytochrome c7-like protein/class III cytochrome C family protein
MFLNTMWTDIKIAPMLFRLALAASAWTAHGAEQPIAYSHKQHIALGLACLDCHSTADTSAAATIPSVQKCMLCHAKVAVDKPEIQKVSTFAKSRREIPWQRVYGFSTEASVRFQHAPHVRAGVQCSTCHGDMTQATTAQPLVKHNMGTCLSCHRKNKASEDCITCHF